VRDTYCSHCGAAYAPPLSYPRACPKCGVEVWANPIPVGVVLLPVRASGGRERTGLLVIRRGIEPAIGKLALVGGFLEEHETWAEGAARELREETNVIVDPKSLEPFWFTSTAPRPNRVLLFASAPPTDTASLGAFAPDHEVTERGLVFGPDGLESVFAFPLHVEAARRFFAARDITGPHAYEVA